MYLRRGSQGVRRIQQPLIAGPALDGLRLVFAEPRPTVGKCADWRGEEASTPRKAMVEHSGLGGAFT